MVALSDRVGLPNETRRALEAELAPLTMLQDVVRWGYAASPPRDVVDVVIQDEFTHDVIVRWRDGGWLVFDTT